MVFVTNSYHGLGPVHWGWDSPMEHHLSHEIQAELCAKAQRGEGINPAAFPALDPFPPSPISDIEQIYPREVNV